MPFQFTEYQPANTGSIVDLMQAPARARAAALRAQGQAKGNSIAGVGQAVTGTIGSILQNRADAPKREMEQLQLNAARTEAQQKKDADALGKDFTQWVQGHGATPPTMEETIARYGAHAAAFEPLIKALNPEPELMNVNPGDSIINKKNPQGGALYTAPPKKEAPITVAPGGTVLDPTTHQPLFTAPDPGKAETERHNRETERIQGLTAGRAAATAAETARHNRATESAANPFSNVSFGAPPAGGPPGVTAPPPAGPPATPSPSGKNDAALQNLPAGVGDLVKRLAEGRQQFPNGMALSKPYWQNILQLVGQYDPSFDAVNYNSRSQTRQKFTSGAEGKQVNALNTVIGHLNDLSTAADKLNNTWSPTWNSLANAVSTAMGHPEVKQFDTIANAVSDEATRVWRQSGGTEADIKSWKESLKNAGSPQQIHAVIATIGDLLNSKLDAMQNQYQQGMGTSDVKMITPQAEATLARLRGKAGGAAPAQAATQQAIPGIPGGIAESTDGGKTWKRVK